MTICANCKREIDNEDYPDVHSAYSSEGCLCEDCWDDTYARCIECGEIFLPEELENDPYDDLICKDCFYKKCVWCEECGEVYYLSDGYEHDGMYYCDNCFFDIFFSCEGCSEYYHGDDAIYHDDCLWCEICFCEYYFHCEICGEVWDINESIETPEGTLVCPDCCKYKCKACGGILDSPGNFAKVNGFPEKYFFCCKCYDLLKDMILYGGTMIEKYPGYKKIAEKLKLLAKKVF